MQVERAFALHFDREHKGLLVGLNQTLFVLLFVNICNRHADRAAKARVQSDLASAGVELHLAHRSRKERVNLVAPVQAPTSQHELGERCEAKHGVDRHGSTETHSVLEGCFFDFEGRESALAHLSVVKHGCAVVNSELGFVSRHVEEVIIQRLVVS